MSSQKIYAHTRAATHFPSGHVKRPTFRVPVRALAAAGLLVLAASRASAQAPLGIPYIGDNHLSFYSTELTTDGVGVGTSVLYGGRYGHRFGSAADATRFSLVAQGAFRNLDDPSGGIMDVSLTAAWTRRVDEVDAHLSVTAAAGASALAWGFDEPDAGLAHLSAPLSLGVSYDLGIRGATLSPFVTPGLAYYSDRTYVNNQRVSTSTGWDGRLAMGASLRLKELVLTTSRIRGEEGLPHRSRWTFSAGISF